MSAESEIMRLEVGDRATLHLLAGDGDFAPSGLLMSSRYPPEVNRRIMSLMIAVDEGSRNGRA